MTRAINKENYMRRGFMNMFPDIPGINVNTQSTGQTGSSNKPEQKEKVEKKFDVSVFSNFDTNKNKTVAHNEGEGKSLFSQVDLTANKAASMQMDVSADIKQKIQQIAVNKYDPSAEFTKMLDGFKHKSGVAQKTFVADGNNAEDVARAQSEMAQFKGNEAARMDTEVRNAASTFQQQVNNKIATEFNKALDDAYKSYQKDQEQEVDTQKDVTKALQGGNKEGVGEVHYAKGVAMNADVEETTTTTKDGVQTIKKEGTESTKGNEKKKDVKTETNVYSKYDTDSNKHVKGAEAEPAGFKMRDMSGVGPSHLDSSTDLGGKSISDVKKMVANNFNAKQMFDRALQSFDFKSGMESIKPKDGEAESSVKGRILVAKRELNNKVETKVKAEAQKANDSIQNKLQKEFDKAFAQYQKNGNKLPDGFKENPISDAPPAAKGEEPQPKAKADAKDKANIATVKNAKTEVPGKTTPKDQVNKKTGLFSKNKAQDDKVMAALIDTLGNVAIAGVGGQQTSSEGVSPNDAAVIQNEMKTRFAGKTPEQILWMNLNAKGLENIDQSTFKKIEADFIDRNVKAGVFEQTEPGKYEVKQDKLTDVRLYKMDAAALKKKFGINA